MHRQKHSPAACHHRRLRGGCYASTAGMSLLVPASHAGNAPVQGMTVPATVCARACFAWHGPAPAPAPASSGHEAIAVLGVGTEACMGPYHAQVGRRPNAPVSQRLSPALVACWACCCRLINLACARGGVWGQGGGPALGIGLVILSSPGLANRFGAGVYAPLRLCS